MPKYLLKVNYNVNGVNAYSIGADTCNFGDAPISWDGSTNQHPVIAQNIYRFKNNRFVHNTYVLGSSTGNWFTWNDADLTAAKWRGVGQDLGGTFTP